MNCTGVFRFHTLTPGHFALGPSRVEAKIELPGARFGEVDVAGGSNGVGILKVVTRKSTTALKGVCARAPRPVIGAGHRAPGWRLFVVHNADQGDPSRRAIPGVEVLGACDRPF